jgi:hypothetical protein
MKPSLPRDVALFSLMLCFSCGPAPVPGRSVTPPLVVGNAAPVPIAGPPRAEALPRPPDDLALLVRMSDPEQLLREVVSILPPSAAVAAQALDPGQVATILIGPKLAAVVDLAQSIDVASVGSKDPSFVLSLAVKPDAEATLGATFGLKEDGLLLHVTRTGNSHDSHDDGGRMRSCAFTSGAGRAVTRLVCASDVTALEAGAAYLARTVASEPLDVDARLTVPGKILRDKTDSTTKAIGDAASAHLGTALVDGFIKEIDRIDAGLRFAGPRIEVTLDLRLSARDSVVAKWLLPRSQPAAPPRAFYRLPADSIVAMHTTGALADDIAPLRRALAESLEAALVQDGYPAPISRGLRERLESLFLTGGPLVFAAGIGGGREGADKAIAALEAAPAHAKPADEARAETLVRTALTPWLLFEVEEPPPHWTQGVRDLVKKGEDAERARAPGSKSSVARDPDGVHADAHVAPLDPAAKLPNDSLHLEIVLVPRTKGKRPPRKAHLYVVPKGNATWIGYSEDAPAIAARLRLAIDDAVETGTLAKSAPAALLRARPAIGAGLVSMVGLPYLAAGTNGATPKDELRQSAKSLARTAALGRGPEPLAWTATADTTPGNVRLSISAQPSRQSASDMLRFLAP